MGSNKGQADLFDKSMTVPFWLGVLNYINPVVIITAIFYFGIKYEKIDAHINDTSIHWTYEKRASFFVPRTELEYKLEDINEKLDKLILQREEQFKNK